MLNGVGGLQRGGVVAGDVGRDLVVSGAIQIGLPRGGIGSEGLVIGPPHVTVISDICLPPTRDVVEACRWTISREPSHVLVVGKDIGNL